jgi:hypothetical protein
MQYTGIVFPQDSESFLFIFPSVQTAWVTCLITSSAVFPMSEVEQIQSLSWISSPWIDVRRRISIVLTKASPNLVHQIRNSLCRYSEPHFPHLSCCQPDNRKHAAPIQHYRAQNSIFTPLFQSDKVPSFLVAQLVIFTSVWCVGHHY